MLRKIRITLATLFVIGITALFLDHTGTVQPVLGWMAKLQFLPSILALNIISVVAVLLLTALFGRIYCSVICPLGVLQDFFAWIGKRRIFRKNKKAKYANRYSYSKEKTSLRVGILTGYVVLLTSGLNGLFVLLAPYSAYGRIVAATLQPIYIAVNNLLARIAEQTDSVMFYEIEQHNNPFILFVVAGVTAIVLFILAFRNGRTYCNIICPVGTVLSVVSKFSLFKMRVNEDKCIKCGLCMKNCKTSCIKVEKGEPVSIDPNRCIDCGNCEALCPKGAISFSLPKKKKAVPTAPEGKESPASVSSEDKESPAPASLEGKGSTAEGISRRSFLGIMGLTAAAAVSAQEKTTDGGYAKILDKENPKRKRPLTPPGSLSAKHLQQHCTACQLCIANCPNGVLRPNLSFDGLMQPVMEYDRGYCRTECTRCSQVCPTGAIRPITEEDKTAIQIGHAVWVKKNCIPVSDGKTCGNCARHCPAGAIQMVPLDKSITINEDDEWIDSEGHKLKKRETLSIPVVDTEYCIGCGACENLCPSRPFSAIYVEGNEVHREI